MAKRKVLIISTVGLIYDGITNLELAESWKILADYKKCRICELFPKCMKMENCPGGERCLFVAERLKEVDTAKFNDTPTIYSTKFKNNKTPSGFENQEETLKKTEFKKQFTTESPTSPKRKKKKKKVLKSKLTVVSSLSKNNELTSKNLKEENLKNLDEINIYKNNNRSNVNKFNFDYGVKSEVKLVNKETERNITIDEFKSKIRRK